MGGWWSVCSGYQTHTQTHDLMSLILRWHPLIQVWFLIGNTQAHIYCVSQMLTCRRRQLTYDSSYALSSYSHLHKSVLSTGEFWSSKTFQIEDQIYNKIKSHHWSSSVMLKVQFPPQTRPQSSWKQLSLKNSENIWANLLVHHVWWIILITRSTIIGWQWVNFLSVDKFLQLYSKEIFIL